MGIKGNPQKIYNLILIPNCATKDVQSHFHSLYYVKFTPSFRSTFTICSSLSFMPFFFQNFFFKYKPCLFNHWNCSKIEKNGKWCKVKRQCEFHVIRNENEIDHLSEEQETEMLLQILKWVLLFIPMVDFGKLHQME